MCCYVVGGVVMAVVVLLGCGGGHVLLRVGACWHGDGRGGAGGIWRWWCCHGVGFVAMALEVMLPTRRRWLCCFLSAWLFSNLVISFCIGTLYKRAYKL